MCHWRKFSIPYSLSWLLFFLPHSLSDIIGPLLSSSLLPLISTVHSHHFLWFPLSTPSDFHCPLPVMIQAYFSWSQASTTLSSNPILPFPVIVLFLWLASPTMNELIYVLSQTQKTTQLGRVMVTNLNWERYTLFLFQCSLPLFAPTLSNVFCLRLVFLLIISILKIYSKISNFSSCKSSKMLNHHYNNIVEMYNIHLF